MERGKKTFGEQAAQFSLYAPFFAIILGVVTHAQAEKSTALIIACTNIVVIFSGLVLGIAALFTIKKYGREGILWRAIVGVALNGMAVAAIATFVLPLLMVVNTRAKVLGRWQGAPSQSSGVVKLGFNDDGSFTFSAENNGSTVADFSGQWIINREKVFGVTIDHVNVGSPKAMGTKQWLGRVKSIDDHQMVFGTDHGDETYSRE